MNESLSIDKGSEQDVYVNCTLEPDGKGSADITSLTIATQGTVHLTHTESRQLQDFLFQHRPPLHENLPEVKF